MQAKGLAAATALLATLLAVLVTLIPAASKGSTISGKTRADLEALLQSLEMYIADTGKIPGEEYPDGANAFPALFSSS